MGTDISGITPEAEALLVRHPWPGNVRELENTLVRAAVLAPGQTLTETDLQLPEATPPPALAGSLAETLRSAVAALVNDPNRPAKELHAAVVAAVERPLIELVLEQTGGNQLRAADLLGINRNTLRKKLDRPRDPDPARRQMTLASRLYLIVDPLDTGRDPVDLARAMLAGGARLLQLRMKTGATRELLAVAETVRELTAAAGATFIVNDRADVARAVGADGVHLGQDDLPVAAARAVLGPGASIGLSTHSETQLAEAATAGADYFAFGPIFATTSKSTADPVLGYERLTAARRLTTAPLVAIGGITPATARDVLTAGADAVAVIAAIVRAPDVERATAELLTLIT